MPNDRFDISGAGSSAPRAATEDVTTRLHGSFDPSPVPEPFVLTVVKGPDQGQSFSLDGSQPSRLLLGQGPACDIRLTDRTVSRRHVGLDVEGGRVRVSDLGSKNGTKINGVKIVEGWVQGGETIQAGSTLFRLDSQPSGAKVALSSATSWGRMIGASTEMRRLYPLLEKLAQSDVPVIIEGDAGTGKELLAECLHEQGPRADGPFVVLDCTAVPGQLLEAELFGHAAGARPGVTEARAGAIERAHGGTLLISEVAELESSLQIQLLRVLERRSVRRIGSDQPIETDFRLLVSTRSDLDREVAAGRFRDELLHRIAVARVELPPLRRRKGDVQVLARHFCQELGGSEQALGQALRLGWDEHPWPGNVRELRSTVARHLALGELAELSAEEPPQADEPVSVDQIIEQALTLPLGEARQRVVVEFERRYVRRVLDRHSGNVTHAAESAGVARRYFQILKARLEKRRKDS
ncbi:MAG TPA: sigma 54-interacting transcriptional regulator [Polyangiaceae bacterium]|nr:sigma 54-interacting transcriptional regulator [Polyangiaceae bacterium]